MLTSNFFPSSCILYVNPKQWVGIRRTRDALYGREEHRRDLGYSVYITWGLNYLRSSRSQWPDRDDFWDMRGEKIVLDKEIVTQSTITLNYVFGQDLSDRCICFCIHSLPSHLESWTHFCAPDKKWIYTTKSIQLVEIPAIRQEK